MAQRESCVSYVARPAESGFILQLHSVPHAIAGELVPEATSGKATLLTFTVNHQPWIPGFDPPYVVAIVEMPEQSGLRLTTNIVNCPIDTVQIGMAVKVVFESVGEGVYLPLFEPQETEGA